MLLDKTIIIKPGKSAKHFTERGYSFTKSNEEIEVDVLDLPKGSSIKVRCKCQICNNEKSISFAKYVKNTRNFNTYYSCSIKCSQEKIKKSNLEKYGVDNPSKSPIIKDKIKNTNLDKYGVEWVSQNSIIRDKQIKTLVENYGVDNPSKSPIIKDKIKNTNLDKYGVENFLSNPLVRDKIIQSNLEKYGVDNPSKSPIIKDKIKNTNLDKYGENHHMKTNKFKNLLKEKSKLRWVDSKLQLLETLGFEYVDDKFIHIACCKEIDINPSLLSNRVTNIHRNSIELCTHCNPLNNKVSSYEKEINDFLEYFDIKTEHSNRVILKGKEIDIFLPDYNIGIEFNGLYWHSDTFKNKRYHKNKHDLCVENKINLVQIFEDEWVNNKELVKSILLSKIGIFKEKIYARNCIIKEIDNKTSRDFLEKNHIQGNCNSSTKLGLYYNGVLVSVMTFGTRTLFGNTEIELLRFCNKLYTNIVGGASKLFKYYLRKYRPSNIVSYCNMRLFSGNIYRKLGFELESISEPDYYWTDTKIRIPRYRTQKHKLVEQGFSQYLSENEIMRLRGFHKIYGVGQQKWILKLN